TPDPFEVNAAASRARRCTDSLGCVAACQPVESLQPPLERLQSLALLDETLTFTLDGLRRCFATELTTQQPCQAVDLFLGIRQLGARASQLRLHVEQTLRRDQQLCSASHRGDGARREIGCGS